MWRQGGCRSWSDGMAVSEEGSKVEFKIKSNY